MATGEGRQQRLQLLPVIHDLDGARKAARQKTKWRAQEIDLPLFMRILARSDRACASVNRKSNNKGNR